MSKVKHKNGVARALLATMLALGLILSSVGTAFAEPVPRDADDPANQGVTGDVPGVLLENDDAYIKKTLNIAPGVAMPDGTFTFTGTLAGVVDHNPVTPAPDPDPYVAVRTWSATTVNMNTLTNTDLGSVSCLTPVNLYDLTFPHAGVYTYNVTESGGSINGVKYNIGTNTAYTMQVYVKNGTDGTLEIYAATVIPGTKTHIDESDDGSKVNPDNTLASNGFEFVNNYAPLVELDITKTTVGAFADLTQAFSFTVNFTFPDTTIADTEVTIAGGTFSSPTPEPNGNIKLPAGASTAEATGSIANGQKIEFTGLPAGTTYKVVETGSPNFTAKATVQEGGVTSSAIDGTTGANYSVTIAPDRDTLIATTSSDGSIDENVTAVTNTYNPINITGVITDNLPFIAIGVLAIAGIALYLVGRMRRANDDE